MSKYIRYVNNDCNIYNTTQVVIADSSSIDIYVYLYPISVSTVTNIANISYSSTEEITIIKTSASNSVIVTAPSGYTINGSATFTITDNYQVVSFILDKFSNDWRVVSTYYTSRVTPSPLTRVNDTNVTLTLGGTPSTALLQSTSLTLGWTGTLADSRITSASTWNNKVTSLAGGTGITIGGTTTVPIVTNSAPDQIVVLTNGTGISVTGTYPNFTITNTASSGSGTVTSVALTTPTGLSISGSPITTSGTLALSLTSGYVIPTTTDETNWNAAYTNRITSLTTTGSSGSSTLSSNTLNIPTYTLSGLGGTTLAAVNAQNLSAFASTTSAQLASIISDETGSGSLVFATSPTLTTAILGSSTATTQSANDNSTKVATTAYVDTGLGTRSSSTHTHTTYSFLTGVVAASVTASVTRYNTFMDGGSMASSDPTRSIIIPYACTLDKFYVYTTTAQTALNSLVITLRKNSVNQSITITLAAGSGAGTYSDLTHSVSCAAGDLISVEFVNNANTASATIGNMSIRVSSTSSTPI